MNTTLESPRLHNPILLPLDIAAGFAAPRARPSEPGLGHALFTRVLDELDYGVMLVGENGRVQFANRAARRDCAQAQGLRMADGHLQARHERDHDALLRALAAARTGRRSLLTFASKAQVQSLAIVPMGELPTGEAAALLVLGRRQVCEPLTVQFFAREHRLTTAETTVLRGLAEGRRPADIARDGGVAMSTVRTQITSIRLKTGARSIGDLVRLVTVLPPIVPVLAN
ncbi:MAG: helix-turn-helix transcriptional regulator [Rhizobacter sp.]